MLKLARDLADRVKETGLRATVKYVRHRVIERYCEWRLGIETSGKLGLEEIGIDNRLSRGYHPTDYPSIRRVLRRLSIREDRDVLVDYGCGMGRVVIYAATWPFRRIIGVEISERLSEIARANVRRARGRLRCRDVEIVTADALSYRLPEDVTIVFMYNPFAGELLAGVLAGMRRSLARAPRELTLVYKNPEPDLYPQLGRCEWLARRRELSCYAGHRIAILESTL